jgi:hypothetical protein
MTDQVRMEADNVLTRDLNKAQTFEDLMDLLHSSLERSGIADRDPVTGQFVRRESLTPTEQAAAAAAAPKEEEHEYTKTEVIGGQEFTFVAFSELELERKIHDAHTVAEGLRAAEPIPQVTPRSMRAKTQAEIEREIGTRSELDMQFRRGELTTTEYLDRTNAFGEYLAEKGFDVEAAAGKQFEQSWAQATQEFLNETPEGRIWKGGQKNREIIGTLIQSHGLVDAQDKVAALRAMAVEMREKGLEFDGDYTPEQVNEMTNSATPQEILEAWKATQPDAETANAEFIRLHQGGSGIFNR